MSKSSKLIDGDLVDFDTFFRSTKDRILRTVIVSTGNQHDAEDCVAEGFRKAFETWNDVQKLNSPAAWVVRVATNLHIDRQRKHIRVVKLWPQLARPEMTEDSFTTVDPNLLVALRRLPERQRQILAYRVLLELPAKETATELSITVATVNTHLHRALQTLRAEFQHQHESEE